MTVFEAVIGKKLSPPVCPAQVEKQPDWEFHVEELSYFVLHMGCGLGQT